MTRLELLKKEKAIVKGLKTLSYDCIDECIRHFDHEIECIEVYGSKNPEYGDDIVKANFTTKQRGEQNDNT